MKYFCIGLIILGLLIAGCFWSQGTVARRTEAVAAPLSEALEALEAGNEDEARALAAEAAAEWGRQEGALASLISHDHTNGVGEALAGLAPAPREELAARLAELLRAVRELGEMERVVWRNIL